MAERQLPPIELLRKLLRYDRRSGKLYWRKRPLSMFKNAAKGRTWNTRWAGKEAFSCINADGYRVGGVLGVSYLGHRVAWALLYGEQPPPHIDHEDLDGSNNRPRNMRAATKSQNGANRVGKGRFKGVFQIGQKWLASIAPNGKSIALGRFDTEEAAAEAYDRAAIQHFGEFARTNFGGRR